MCIWVQCMRMWHTHKRTHSAIAQIIIHPVLNPPVILCTYYIIKMRLMNWARCSRSLYSFRILVWYCAVAVASDRFSWAIFNLCAWCHFIISFSCSRTHSLRTLFVCKYLSSVRHFFPLLFVFPLLLHCFCLCLCIAIAIAVPLHCAAQTPIPRTRERLIKQNMERRRTLKFLLIYGLPVFFLCVCVCMWRCVIHTGDSARNERALREMIFSYCFYSFSFGFLFIRGVKDLVWSVLCLKDSSKNLHQTVDKQFKSPRMNCR